MKITGLSELKMIWGVVGPNANPISGEGFEVTAAGTGNFTITFTSPFNTIPSVVATQVEPNDINEDGGNTRDNAVIVGIETTATKIRTGNGDGKAADRAFSFIAIGK